MIQTKEDLREYIKADKLAFSSGRDSRIIERLLKTDTIPTERCIRLLRYVEFYRNNSHKGMFYKIMYYFYRIRASRFGKKLNLSIALNVCGPGLRVTHPSGIMISRDAKIGRNFHVRKDALIGNSLDADHKAATIGDYVEFGVGAQAVGAVVIGRGAIIGNGAVVVRKVPPYAIAIGNPAKVVGFRMTPEEVVVFEKDKYPESERIPIEELKANYQKYFVNKHKEIRKYLGNI
jgi:serine O-acetyltransferase